MDNQKFLLEMKNISKEFPGVKALDNAKLQIKKGSVHALMGENGAGKSTLMKCLFGVYKKDSGIIKLNGQVIEFNTPKQALNNGVAMVHQELNQVSQMTVADNIWLGRYPNNLGVVSNSEYIEKTLQVFKELGLDIDPNVKMSKLSVSDRQMVEIAKAVSYDSKIVVLDEPTSSLASEEVKRLFVIIKKLKDAGCGIIYISHKMEEILEICDEVTVMRDGKWVATHSASDLTTDTIIKLMVGRELTNRYPDKTNKISQFNVLEVKNLTGKYPPCINDVNFELKKGEILGVSGLVGSRRTELLETIFGIATKSSGEIIINGKHVYNKTPRESIINGFALLTEERRKDGIFGGLDITFNSIISSLKKYTRFGIINNKKTINAAKWVIEKLNVKTPSSTAKIRNLSGGNQQKVILGRWLLNEPEVFLLDEPTRGIDVGAKFEIYQLIIDLASKGKGIIVVSSEMPELLGICDRILVMSNGRVAGIEPVTNLSQEKIMELSAKYI
ncbi:MAG: ATP-binding cassette domain-containing protein [Clostridia bacterium]|nr:ATP-binding cassette domain-containing protein [Clostridia bacterium]